MRLVEDDDLVLGEHRPAAGEVRPVEVGVDDHDVGRRGAVAGGFGEAAAARRAVVGARALPRTHAQHVPGPIRRLEAQVGPVPTGRRLRPGHQATHLVDQTLWRCLGLGPPRPLVALRLVRPARSRVAELRLDPTRPHLGHPLAADVVAPPLQDGEVQRDGEAEPRLDRRQVLLGELVLQRLGGGGDDHLPAAERRRDEVGQRLAGAGTGLDDEVCPRHQRLGHRPAHLLLLGAVLTARHLRRDLVQSADGVVAGLTGVRHHAGGTEDVEVGEVVDVLDPVVLHPPIMPARRVRTSRPGPQGSPTCTVTTAA